MQPDSSQGDTIDPCYAPDVCSSSSSSGACDLATQAVDTQLLRDVFRDGFESCEPYDLTDASCRIHDTCNVVNAAARTAKSVSYFAAIDYALRRAPFDWEWCACARSHAARLEAVSISRSCLDMSASGSTGSACALHPAEVGDDEVRVALRDSAARRPCFQYSTSYSLKAARATW